MRAPQREHAFYIIDCITAIYDLHLVLEVAHSGAEHRDAALV